MDSACRFLLPLLLIVLTNADLDSNLRRLEWMVGTWRADYGGITQWPTIPSMNYGEELIIQEAPVSKAASLKFLNYSARAWSHGTQDHLHDEWGYIGVDSRGYATLMTTGNNGFNKYEVGPILNNEVRLELEDIGRVAHIRDLPVEKLKRTFRLLSSGDLEQKLEMRTSTHPKRYNNGGDDDPTLLHTQIFYRKVEQTGPSANKTALAS